MKTRIATFVLPAVLSFCAIAATQSDNDNTLPSQITTRDGKTYSGVEKVRVDPDGILVDFQPAPGGFGVAKLKFRNLSDDLQKKYDYNEKKAVDFENQQAVATGQMLATRTADEAAVTRYRDLAELHQALAGEDSASYSVALEANNVVAAHGVTQTEPSQTFTNVDSAPYVYTYSSSYPTTPPKPAPTPTYGTEPLPEFDPFP